MHITRRLGAIVAAAAAVPLVFSASPAHAATYTVTVTCKVPRLQPERQLAPNHCLNYLPDATQTFIATVTDAAGQPVPGVWVAWSDNSPSAKFRVKKNPCMTDATGRCSDELVDRDLQSGKVIEVTAKVGSDTGTGYLSFS
jgi:hypothetical protein